MRNLPPLAEGLQQPGDLAEVSLVAKAMAIVLKTTAQSFFVDLGHVLFDIDSECEQNLSREVVLTSFR